MSTILIYNQIRVMLKQPTAILRLRAENIEQYKMLYGHVQWVFIGTIKDGVIKV